MPILARRKPEAAAFVSPERAALAAAIAALHEADAVHAAARQAIDFGGPGWRKRNAAEEAVEAAQEALTKAEKGVAEHAIAEAMGRAAEPPPSVPAVRAALAAAETDLAIARRAIEDVKPIAEEAERNRPYLVMSRDRAASAVLAAEAGPTALAIAERFKAAERELVELGATVKWFVENGALPKVTVPGGTYGRAADPDVRDCLLRMGMMSRAAEFPGAVDGARMWRDALATLREDAAAVLPA